MSNREKSKKCRRDSFEGMVNKEKGDLEFSAIINYNKKKKPFYKKMVL